MATARETPVAPRIKGGAQSRAKLKDRLREIWAAGTVEEGGKKDFVYT